MTRNQSPKILVAGVGNELRQDDAFGIELIRKLQETELPDNVTAMEVGIGGIHLVQQLHNGYDVLIIADAVDWDGEPGTVAIRQTKVGNIEDMPVDEQRAFLADMHYTNPTRALMLAKGVKVLPDQVYILGCTIALHDDFEMKMSRQVSEAIPKALDKLNEWIAHLEARANS